MNRNIRPLLGSFSKSVGLLTVFTVMVLFLPGCTSPERQPASTVAISQDLESEVMHLKEHFDSPRFTAETCAPFLNERFTAVFQLKSDYFNRTGWTPPVLEKMVKNLFEGRLILRKKLGQFYAENRLSDDCINAARNAMRAARFVEDYLGELAVKPTVDHHPAFHRGLYYLKGVEQQGITPGIRASAELSAGFDLYSGDILLSRGAPYSSAAIARVGEIDAQFSHLALVYVHPKTRIPYTVEAHLESGVVVAEFSEYIKDGKMRVMQFRHPDRDQAHRAAQRAFTKVRIAQESNKRILYDFAMDGVDRKELFCSEVANYGYDLEWRAQKSRASVGTNPRVDIPPLFHTKIDRRNIPFLSRIGVKATSQIFVPADMEVDFRWDVIAEWRDLNRVRDSWMKDMIVTRLYDWMGVMNYKFHSQKFFKSMGSAQGRKLYLAETLSDDSLRPFVNFVLRKINTLPPIPVNISEKGASTIAAVELIGAQIQKSLKAKALAQKYFPAPTELIKMIEEIRQEDMANYQQGDKKAFHNILRPAGSAWFIGAPHREANTPATGGTSLVDDDD